MIDWNEARALWADGFDTLEIAEAFSTDEADIYNGLALGKGREVDHATSSQAA